MKFLSVLLKKKKEKRTNKQQRLIGRVDMQGWMDVFFKHAISANRKIRLESSGKIPRKIFNGAEAEAENRFLYSVIDLTHRHWFGGCGRLRCEDGNLKTFP